MRYCGLASRMETAAVLDLRAGEDGQMDKEQQIIHSWTENASAWTESVRGNQIESRKVATNKAIVDCIRKYNPHKVLDVGCGEGWLVRELAQCGMEVVGTDCSAPLIDRARESGSGTFLGLTYDDLCSTSPFEGTKFDAIVCNFALVGESVSQLLSSLRNLLSADGKLFIQTVHPFAVCGDQDEYKDGWRTETFSNFGSDYKESMPWYFRTVGSWLNIITDAGLKVDQCDEPINPSTGKPLSLLFTCSEGQS